MIIRCKKTRRFLCEVNIEEYLANLKNIGISQEIPLKITCVCKNCKRSEIYEVYKDHYIFLKNKEISYDK